MKFLEKILFWRKKKEKNLSNISIDPEDFRILTSKEFLEKSIIVDGKKITIKFRTYNLTNEEMSSIVCENFYKKRWRN